MFALIFFQTVDYKQVHEKTGAINTSFGIIILYTREVNY